MAAPIVNFVPDASRLGQSAARWWCAAVWIAGGYGPAGGVDRQRLILSIIPNLGLISSELTDFDRFIRKNGLQVTYYGRKPLLYL